MLLTCGFKTFQTQRNRFLLHDSQQYIVAFSLPGKVFLQIKLQGIFSFNPFSSEVDIFSRLISLTFRLRES